MFVIDTNVVSELRRHDRANPNVLGWMGRQQSSGLFISVMTVFELELGALLIARKDAFQSNLLRKWIDGQVLPSFRDRILPVDAEVAIRCAAMHVPNRRSERDAFIAATAIVHGMAVVTRNVMDFEGTGATIINPWAND